MVINAGKAEKVSDGQTSAIEKLLRKHFPRAKVDAYRRRDLHVIHVRVADKCFQDMTTAQRENKVFPLLAELPEDTRADITFLLLVTPEEMEGARAVLNLEFEQPSPSLL